MLPRFGAGIALAVAAFFTAPLAVAQVTVDDSICVAVHNSQVYCPNMTVNVGLSGPKAKAWVREQLARLAKEILGGEKVVDEQTRAKLDALYATLEQQQAKINDLSDLAARVSDVAGTNGLIAKDVQNLAGEVQALFDALMGVTAKMEQLDTRVDGVEKKLAELEDDKWHYTIDNCRWVVGVHYAYEGLKPDARIRTQAVGIVVGFRLPYHVLVEPHGALAIPFGGATGEIVGGEPTSTVLETINDMDVSGFYASLGVKLGYEWDRGLALFASLDVRSRKLRYKHAAYDSFASDWTTEGVSSVGLEARLRKGLILSFAAGFVWASRIRLPEYAYNLEGTSLHAREGANDSWQFFLQPALLFGFDEP